MIESKKTSGGWFNIFEFLIYEYRVRIMSEVSCRKAFLSKEMILINSDFLFPYKICLLAPKSLVEEKIDAFLIRKKARDVFEELKLFLPLSYQALLKGIKEKIVNEF